MLNQDTSVPPTGENDSGMTSDTGVSYESSVDTGTMDANPTETSSGSGSDANTVPQSLSDVVSGALSGKGDSSTSGQSDTQKSKTDLVDPKAEPSKDQQQKDGASQEDIPTEFHKHPAWQRLKTQRDEARAEIDQYRSDSQEYKVITGYMQQNSIAAEDVAETLQWLALKNSDPIKFGEMIVGLANQFQESMGLVLPKEIQSRVETGEISEEDAKALARAQAEARLYKNRNSEQAQREAAQREAAIQTQNQKQMADAVNEWAKQISGRDPDYQAKHQLVQSEIRAYIQQFGMPKDVATAIKYADAAYKSVTEHLVGILPKRKPNSPAPQGGRQVETNFVPKSLEDVVSHALAGGS